MSSSSIEVMGMGGGDMKVVLLENSIHDEEMAQRMQDIIHSTGPPGHIIDTGPPLSQHAGTGQDEEFAQIDEFSSLDGVDPPPGTIIFSPQDLVRPTKISTRGRGRGRGFMPIIKHEPPQILGGKPVEVSVACEICGKVMMTGKTLVQHMAIHSDLKPFQCPHCPKSFARKVHLQGHLVVHGIEKQFECPVCHQRFSRQDCVKVHMRLHDKSKCVYCDVCHKAFLTVGALNIHLRIHRGEKPFKCHLCSKCFTQKNHLITHIKRHTKVTDEHFTKKLGPRMFKCEHCTRAFIRLSDYERHVQWNHGAVADGSIIDKLPTVGNLLDGEMKQTGVAPQIFKAPKDALKNKATKYQRRGRNRVMMCTTSTQTDEDGGHVIIPRMYQNRISAGTQVSAPPTPRPNDDDMYENDIFDEGMDRNYSSEDEDDPEDLENEEERKIYVVAETSDMASDPVQDAAFDAIVQGSSTKSLEDISLRGKVSNEKEAVFLQDVVSSISKQGLDVREEEEEEEEEMEEEAERITPDQVVSESTGLLRNEEETVISVEDDTSKSQEVKEGTEFLEDRETVVQELKQRLACAKGEESQQPQEEERMQIVENDEEQSQESGEALITVNREELEDQSQEALTTAEDTLNFDNKLLMESPFQPPPVQKSRGRGRPKGRGRGKLYWNGLTGAAELRAIRKSMMQILHANQENKEDENKEEEENNIQAAASNEETEDSRVAVSAEEGESEGRVKRMAKKQHGKDFVCNMKNCETCIPSLKPASKIQIKAKVKVCEKDTTDSEILKSTPLIAVPRESPKPVAKAVPSVKTFSKPLVKGFKAPEKPFVSPFMPKLKENMGSPAKKMKVDRQDSLAEKREDFGMKVGNRVGTYPVDIRANPLTNKKPKKPDYFVATSKSDSIVSPPVELMSFCIPTYSCKLCGREFRFEGKLHRHIESVHQNKAIFSADVKPGRSSGKGMMPGTYIPKLDEMSRQQPTLEPENPEIAALRSEWDDDDDDDDVDDESENPLAITADAAPVSSVTTFTSQPFTIVTREITPVTTTVSESQYASGVKVNMNKLAGLLSADRSMPTTSQGAPKASSVTRVTTTTTSSLSRHPRDPETIMADTLDAKCRRLLEKLFDHDLLLNCGLLEEHVSVVLGRVLQHYGVKMIEDYGQGQYEVLKYNLWRLIEWKVTMEQMEEFYTAGKSVEEMMDDIMNERVPLVSHHFVPHEQKAHPPTQVSQAGQVTQVEAVEVADGQMVLQQVAGVLGGQLNLPEGVTQVVLAQDVSPELLQGAHIVTIDPTTGQVISQVTADQVILTDAIGDELEQQVAALDGQVVVSQAHIVDQNVTQESIVVPQSTAISVHGGQGQISHGQVVVHAAPHQQSVKLETTSLAAAQQHHSHHQ